ncbi:4-hydroxy-tetrahydrodipicolinate synthase [Anaplasma marginale]|uniref:4-hydroxy-tetrahydrodipicolinate synthase n=1 Tax=Anaplasma marginale TaxID=770 RepID=UPI000DEF4E9B|nr:4-hydroxy-tetrahydrodipicolinate synthase [Anaplasma marginale]RCL20230.1 4-hydroxy-tetrahydrodipicolinate synthase [Anaplasma marginale]
MKLSGVFTALATPFRDDLSLDERALASFVDWQISSGISGIVPCGTTGESATLNFEEYCAVVRLCVETARGRVLVIAGAGSHCTTETISRALFVQSAGADAALIVVPYYNRPSDEGVYQHFRAVHDATNIPIVLYNVPQRTAIDISNDTIRRIAELPRVVGIKDCTGAERAAVLRAMLPEKVAILSGEDETALASYMNGGSGCISVVSNVAPNMALELYNLHALGKIDKAKRVGGNLAALSRVLFIEPSPSPTKYALSLMGKMRPKVRLPLVELASNSQTAVKNVLETLDLLRQQKAMHSQL